MDILALMQKDHTDVMAQIDALQRRTQGKASPKTREAVTDLVLTLRLQAKTLEVACYEVLEYVDPTVRQLCLEGYNQHDLVDTMLDKLLLLPAGGDDELAAALAVCKDLLAHHKARKAAMFAQIQGLVRPELLKDMAEVMHEEREMLRPALAAQIDEFVSSEPPMRDTVPLSRGTSDLIHHLRANW